MGKGGCDLCGFQGRTLLVVCDYYSNFIEVKNITNANTSGICKYGVPDSDHSLLHSPESGVLNMSLHHYPQSNGKAENAVKTVKLLFAKSRGSPNSLLSWTGETYQQKGWVPAQHRDSSVADVRPFCPLPDHCYSLTTPLRKIERQKQCQEYYYNQRLKPIAAGEAVRMRLPGQKGWNQGVCTGLVGPRSYRVKVGESMFIRNSKQLIRSGEELTQSPPDADDLQQPWNNPSEKAPRMPTSPSNGAAPSADHPEPPSSPNVAPPVEQTATSRTLQIDTKSETTRLDHQLCANVNTCQAHACSHC